MNKSSVLWRIGLLGGVLALLGGASFYFQNELFVFFYQLYDVVDTSIAQNYQIYAFGYVLAYILDSAFALPLASGLTLLAGHFFGFFAGLLLTLLGMVAGAMLSFFAVRYFVGGYFQKAYSVKLDRFNSFFERYGNLFFLFVRFVPVIPFSMVNILAAFTKISWRAFAFMTVLGMLPLVVVLLLLGTYGSQIATIHLHTLLIWFSLLGFVVFLFVFFLKKYRPML